MKRQIRLVWRHTAWSVLVIALFTLSACIEAADEEVLRELNEMGASRGNVFPDREDFYDAFVLDANNAWVAGGRGLILHVTNNGQDFTMLETGVQKAIYEIDFATAEDGVAVGQDGIVLKTDDGKTWTRIPIELPLLDWAGGPASLFRGQPWCRRAAHLGRRSGGRHYPFTRRWRDLGESLAVVRYELR